MVFKKKKATETTPIQVEDGDAFYVAPDVRTFSTGACRDADKDKPEYCGFTSWEVLVRFGEYMHKNRFMKDGSRRDSDNWKKGIPRKVYMESLYRHWVDFMALADAEKLGTENDPNYEAMFDDSVRDSMEEALCAMFFNVQGLLYELLNGR
jgi:hypothetical protein